MTAIIAEGLMIGRTPLHAQERRGECAIALLAEIARDYFPSGQSDMKMRAAAADLTAEQREEAAWEERRDMLEDAGNAFGAFTRALMLGDHGPGCPARDEQDAADERNNRGLEAYCATCGAEVHMFRDMAGWHHFRGPGTADNPV